MKRSERLIRNTIVGLAGLMVSYVGVSRLYAGNPTAAQRSSVAELSRLRDFNAVDVEGNFTIDIVQSVAHAVDLPSTNSDRSGVFATMREDTLVLRGAHDASTVRVRVALPVLSRLTADSVTSLSVSGFTGATLSLQLHGTAQTSLLNNRIGQWHINSEGASDLRIDRTTLNAGQFDLAGRVTLTVSD